MTKVYDRTAEDLGNIINLGHVNVNITDQRLATQFYVSGLGLTRDPFLNTGTRIMWVNAGMSQFHLPTGEPTVLNGTIGLVMRDREAVLGRLAEVAKGLEGTKYRFDETNDGVEVTCPWGNRMRVHTPDAERFGRMALGMPYIEFNVRPGTAEGIARFYREVMLATSEVIADSNGRKAKVEVGEKQFYYFRETDRPIPAYDGHHVQIFITNFSGPYKKLVELGLLTIEFGQHEYRFNEVIDLDTREVLFTMEHEVRSHTHPMYGRPLINRNPTQNNRDYKPGHDSISWALP
jgi:hypothetical protein